MECFFGVRLSYAYNVDGGALSNYLERCGLFHAYKMSIPFTWSMDIIIDSWFHKFILYDMKWMFIYLMGSQPWHVAIKWYTCNHMRVRGDAQSECKCNKSSFLIIKYGIVVFLLVVCSICWIKFQPLWFAIKKISISLMDKVFDLDQGILWNSSLKLLASNLTTECASVKGILGT